MDETDEHILNIKKLNLLVHPQYVRGPADLIFIIKQKAGILDNQNMAIPFRDELRYFVDQTTNGVAVHGILWYAQNVYIPLQNRVHGTGDSSVKNPWTPSGKQTALVEAKPKMPPNPIVRFKRESSNAKGKKSSNGVQSQDSKG